MGIQVEFNPDLALRVFNTKGRKKEECLPEELEPGKFYNFLKKGQRNFWLEGEIPLVETKGNQRLSRPLASITIMESTHILFEGEVYTKGTYRINEVYNPNDPTIRFEGMNKIK